MRQFLPPLFLLPLVALGSCTANTPTPPPSQSSTVTPSGSAIANRQVRVIATFLPVYLFTKAVAGNAAQVDVLIPPGTEVHEYQSRPADVKAIAEADIVVKNGLGIEEFLDSTIKGAENPRLKVIDASKGIQPLQEISPVVSSGKSEGDHSHDHDHDHGAGNPHVWLDPMLAKQQVENIRDGLIAADPANQATYRANAAAYIQQLEDLNQQFEQQLKGFSDRTFVTFHDAFPYLARRYQLKQVAVVTIPDEQLSPTDVQNAIAAVKQYRVKALLSEPGVDNKLLASLSQDLKLTLRPLDSLESGERDPQYYFLAMRNNLKTLEAAFK